SAALGSHCATEPKKAGAVVLFRHPVRVQLVVADSRAEVQQYGVLVAHNQRIPDHLVAERPADPGLRRIPDVVEVEQEEVTTVTSIYGRLGAADAIVAQPREVHAVLIINGDLPGSRQGANTGWPRGGTLERTASRRRRTLTISHQLASRPSLTSAFSEVMSRPDALATVRMSDAKSSSMLPLPTSWATRLRVTLATGMTTPSSSAAASPRSKSFCNNTLVNVGVKSRLINAGDLYRENTEPITESFRKDKNASRLTPDFSVNTVISAIDWMTTPRNTLWAILT